MSLGRNCNFPSSIRLEEFSHSQLMFHRYHTDPSGTFMRYEAKAIGSGSEAAQAELQDKWHKVSLP